MRFFHLYYLGIWRHVAFKVTHCPFFLPINSPFRMTSAHRSNILPVWFFCIKLSHSSWVKYLKKKPNSTHTATMSSFTMEIKIVVKRLTRAEKCVWMRFCRKIKLVEIIKLRLSSSGPTSVRTLVRFITFLLLVSSVLCAELLSPQRIPLKTIQRQEEQSTKEYNFCAMV